jgi:imidazoleglycerol-phosphate dehydratase
MSLEGMAVTATGTEYRTRRETREALVQVAVTLDPPAPRRRAELATTLAFFDHMLEMLGWYADLVIDAAYDVRTFRLEHVVMEDVGLAVGAAVAAALRDRIAAGVESSAFALGVMDESSAQAQVSFEGRANTWVHRGGASALERVEDVKCVDLVAFFEGFSQGARATVHLRIDDGARDPHHAWEAAFRAFARALRGALAPNPLRAGLTAGVKGTLD